MSESRVSPPKLLLQLFGTLPSIVEAIERPTRCQISFLCVKEKKNLFSVEFCDPKKPSTLARFKQTKYKDIQERLWIDDCYQLVYKVKLQNLLFFAILIQKNVALYVQVQHWLLTKKDEQISTKRNIKVDNAQLEPLT